MISWSRSLPSFSGFGTLAAVGDILPVPLRVFRNSDPLGAPWCLAFSNRRYHLFEAWREPAGTWLVGDFTRLSGNPLGLGIVSVSFVPHRVSQTCNRRRRLLEAWRKPLGLGLWGTSRGSAGIRWDLASSRSLSFPTASHRRITVESDGMTSPFSSFLRLGGNPLGLGLWETSRGSAGICWDLASSRSLSFPTASRTRGLAETAGTWLMGDFTRLGGNPLGLGIVCVSFVPHHVSQTNYGLISPLSLSFPATSHIRTTSHIRLTDAVVFCNIEKQLSRPPHAVVFSRLGGNRWDLACGRLHEAQRDSTRLSGNPLGLSIVYVSLVPHHISQTKKKNGRSYSRTSSLFSLGNRSSPPRSVTDAVIYCNRCYPLFEAWRETAGTWRLVCEAQWESTGTWRPLLFPLSTAPCLSTPPSPRAALPSVTDGTSFRILEARRTTPGLGVVFSIVEAQRVSTWTWRLSPGLASFFVLHSACSIVRTS
ncbi:hypothetical protein K438DRAFT_1759629 [Mycena galopus ATCC 62051]|nr:hypothetical protein K438DRAFT_1759629 [Mycena galopus ATCC 62051]